MIVQITDVEKDKALATLGSAELNVPEMIIMLEGSRDRETARRALDRADGRIRKAIEVIKK